MKINFEDFKIERCTISNLNEILLIQEEVLAELSECILRENTVDMLRECLGLPHITLGAWHEEKLVAFSILYFTEWEDIEDLAHLLDSVNSYGLKAVNYKLCIVRKEYRGNSLQYKMGKLLKSLAVESGVQIICATVAPNNEHSIENIEKLGFIYNKTLVKYGFDRNLYYQLLESNGE